MMNVTENAEKGAEKAPHSDYLDEDHVQKSLSFYIPPLLAFRTNVYQQSLHRWKLLVV